MGSFGLQKINAKFIHEDNQNDMIEGAQVWSFIKKNTTSNCLKVLLLLIYMLQYQYILFLVIVQY